MAVCAEQQYQEKAWYTHEYSVCTAPYMHVHIQSMIDRGPQSPYLQHQSILSLVPHRITYVSPLFEPEGLSYFLVKPTSSSCGGRNGVVWCLSAVSVLALLMLLRLGFTALVRLLTPKLSRDVLWL